MVVFIKGRTCLKRLHDTGLILVLSSGRLPGTGCPEIAPCDKGLSFNAINTLALSSSSSGAANLGVSPATVGRKKGADFGTLGGSLGLFFCCKGRRYWVYIWILTFDCKINSNWRNWRMFCGKDNDDEVGGKMPDSFWGQPTWSGRDWKPNPHSAPSGIGNNVTRGERSNLTTSREVSHHRGYRYACEYIDTFCTPCDL